jgi:hypothetical protein
MSDTATGLYPIGETGNEATADVVFVHGLGGHYQTTWQSDGKNPETLWPEWMYHDLNADGLKVNVWSLAYPADAFRAGRGDCPTRRRNPAARLADRREQNVTTTR